MLEVSPFSYRNPRGLSKVFGVACILLFGLTACQPTTVINKLTPRDKFELKRDLVYGPDPRQRLDLYSPVARPVNAAIVIFVHGGGWDSGDKDQYLFVGQAFSSLGYITAIPNYRLYPQVQFPLFVEDVALAVAALHRLLPAEACAGKLELVLVGHSAGAHTAAMLAIDRSFLERNDADVDLRAFIGLAGPYDVPLDDPGVVGKFDTISFESEANPVALAGEATPPTLLIHGDQDTTVGLHHTRRLKAKLDLVGVPATLRIYPDTNHTRVIGSLASSLRFLNPAFDDIAHFLHTARLDRACSQSAEDGT